MSLYLVTGGAGFIGSNIVEELVRAQHNIRVLDNLSTGKLSNLEPFLKDIEMIEGDICHLETVRLATVDVDFVLHQAAYPSVMRSISDPLASHQTNATGTLHVLIAAKEARVKRVVCASSSSIYGNNPTLPKHEDMTPVPLSPYAASKLASESYCKAFTNVYDIPTITLRYFNVFGPQQDPTSQYSAAIPKFITKMLNGDTPMIYGDGQQSRDFTYVKNVVYANLLASEAPSNISGTFNVGCGTRYTLLDLIGMLNTILGLDIKPKFAPDRPGDVKHSLADLSKIKQLLGYIPKVDFEEGLRLTVESLQVQQHTRQ